MSYQDRYTDQEIALAPGLIDVATRYAMNYEGQFAFMLQMQMYAIDRGDLTPGMARGALNCLRLDPMAPDELRGEAEYLRKRELVSEPGASAREPFRPSHPTRRPHHLRPVPGPVAAPKPPEPRLVVRMPVTLKRRYGVPLTGYRIHIAKNGVCEWRRSWDGGWEFETMTFRVEWRCGNSGVDPEMYEVPPDELYGRCRMCWCDD